MFGPAAPSPFPLPHLDRSFDAVGPRPRLDSMSSVEEDDYDTLTDIDSDKNVIRTKVRRIALPCPDGSGGRDSVQFQGRGKRTELGQAGPTPKEVGLGRSGLTEQILLAYLTTEVWSLRTLPTEFWLVYLTWGSGVQQGSFLLLLSNTSVWLIWHERTNVFCGKSTRFTSGEWPAQIGTRVSK